MHRTNISSSFDGRRVGISHKYYCVLLVMLFSCNSFHANNWRGYNGKGLEVIRESSDLLKCNWIMGRSVKRMEEENEMLVLIGVIDTNSEMPPLNVAQIKVDKEVRLLVLDTINTSAIANKYVYADKDCKLTLQYDAMDKDDNESISGDVNCVLQCDSAVYKYYLISMRNRHDY